MLAALSIEEQKIELVTTSYLEDVIYLAEDIHVLYGALFQELEGAFPDSKVSAKAGAKCLLECRRLLAIGMLTLLRGHIADSAIIRGVHWKVALLLCVHGCQRNMHKLGWRCRRVIQQQSGT